MRVRDDNSDHTLTADLTNLKDVTRVVRIVSPDVVLSCAGVVANDETAQLNTVFTENILEAVHVTGARARVIICGSAGVYGRVNEEDLPVSEETELGADSGYGLSKLQEEERARELAATYSIPLVVARIFNPVGAGMHPRLLLPQLIGQIQDILSDNRQAVEIGRLDACRDYVSVKDVATALALLASSRPKYDTYNIGSGQRTSNQQLVQLVVEALAPGQDITVNELSEAAEPLVACQADIRRMKDEFGWGPSQTLEDTIKEIVYA